MMYEVVLVLTAEAQLEEETAFVVEVHQAGIFTVKSSAKLISSGCWPRYVRASCFPTTGVARRAGGQG